jgi:5-methylcytosine-specific restriction endonuclease McrA
MGRPRVAELDELDSMLAVCRHEDAPRRVRGACRPCYHRVYDALRRPHRDRSDYRRHVRLERPEQGRAQRARRRARERATEATLTVLEWQAILEWFDFRCAYCFASGPLELEHVVSVSSGGGTTADNCVPACRPCNASKGARPLRDWLEI